MKFNLAFIAISSLLAVNAAPVAQPADEKPAQTSAPAAVNTPSIPKPAEPYNWNAGFVDSWEIHSSCNATNRNQLERAFQDTIAVAQHAREHILRYGNSSEIFKTYFGQAASAEPMGWFDKIANGDKTGLLFRCDDIDGNCKNPGWAGHWRGENGTDETVICDLSYTSRLYNDQICSRGYTVAGSKTAETWAGDILHRIMHTTKGGEDVTGHYADTYQDCVELGKKDPAKAVRNSASLRYFALHAWAYDIAVPGVGCLGTPAEEKKKEEPKATSASSSAASTPTKAAPAECHTHADGVVHCA